MEETAVDAVLQSDLIEFSKNPSNKISPTLEKYLLSVAKTGCTRFPWTDVRVLLAFKMDAVMKNFDSEFSMDCLGRFPNVENVTFSVLHQRILERFITFNAAPFTVQRLCELLTAPKDHYKRSDKFLRGLEKSVMVVSCVDPQGKKLSHEPAPITDTSLLHTLCPGAKAHVNSNCPAVTPAVSPFKPPSPVAGAHAPRPSPSDARATDKSSTVMAGTPPTPWGSPVVKATCMSSDESEPPLKQARIEPCEEPGIQSPIINQPRIEEENESKSLVDTQSLKSSEALFASSELDSVGKQEVTCSSEPESTENVAASSSGVATDA